MSRITKEIATIVAHKLTAKKAKLRDEANEKLKKEFTKMVKLKIPEEVYDFNKKYPNYINLRNSLQLQGNGWNYESISFTEPLPIKERAFIPTKEQSEILKKLHADYKSKETDVKQLRDKIERLLYSLRTYSKVNLEFPEATPFLPSIKETGLALNISDIRNEL